MNYIVKITDQLLREIHADLDRPHPVAAERVGFLACKTAQVDDGTLLLASTYQPVADQDYIHSLDAGAVINGDAFRKALQHAMSHKATMLHVHRHEHRGAPRFSRLDLRESAKFIPDFWKVRPGVPHGALVLSHDSGFALIWDPVTLRPMPALEISVVGRPIRLFR